ISAVLCVTAVRGHWAVTYTSTQVCAIKGSTVNIQCSYRYPSRIQGHDTVVQKEFWQTTIVPEDLTTRVQYQCEDKTCTLTIRDLRETDSAQYNFRFITNQPGGKYSGSPGVTLTVRALQLQVHVSRSTVNQFPPWIELTCHSSCQLPDHTSYVWYRNEQKAEGEKRYFHLQTVDPADRYYCAIKGPEGFPSSPVYAPKLLSVSVSPSAEIVEGSSLTLTCSSDANPAAKHTWYKRNHTLLSKEPQLLFNSIQSTDSGEYYCTAENDLGKTTSGSIFIHVAYPPKLLSVSVSPSAEIVEGSSVTLTCSSDANPAANYTWYKENEDCYFSCYFALYMEPTQLRV
uniref:B-cell receptor CD22 n=1 Tax=Mastacembelus armatus TaxID=205130 RepID=A0A3Q3L105_9TELE